MRTAHHSATAQAHAFAQHRYGHEGDEQRHGKEDRIGLRHGQARKGEEARDPGQDGRDGADKAPPRVAGDEVFVPLVRQEHGRDEGEGQEAREEDDLDGVVAAAEEFHDDVMGGVDPEGGKGEGGPGKVGAGDGHGAGPSGARGGGWDVMDRGGAARKVG